MNRTIGLSVLAVALLLAWQSYAVWSMLQTCGAKARAIIAAADPLDREPPPQVASIIERTIPFDRLVDYLSTTLLERYTCRGEPNWRGTEWLIDKPFLDWHLHTTFSKTELIALFASTSDMRKGDVGLSRGARRIFGRDTSQLGTRELTCLVNKILGRQNTTLQGVLYYSVCEDPIPPPPSGPVVIPPPGEIWSRPSHQD